MPHREAGRSLPVETVRVGDLLIDREHYQRPLRKSTLLEIQGNWDDYLGLPGLLVNRRSDGTLAVIDGGHRITAFLVQFGQDAPITVSMTYGLSLASEAWLFARLNALRKMVTAGERTRGLVVAEDDKAKAVVQVLDSLGVPYAWQPGKMNRGKLFCWAVIQDVYDAGGTPLLSATLSLVDYCWPETPERWQGWVIEGTARFLRFYAGTPQFKERRVWDKLKQRTLLELRSAAMVHKSRGFATDVSFAFALRDWVNHARKENRLPPTPAER
jgi:hypothetical protein